MNDATKVQIGSALFGAQNLLDYFTARYLGDDFDGMDIEPVKKEIRTAIANLGGVEHLLELGA